MNIDTHLGSGKGYEKYYKVEPSLLVAIPRLINREKNNITSNFKGLDVWHCYEFSTIHWNGFPIVGVLKIIYPSDSLNIVESKSLKLYLNSWNFEVLSDANTYEQDVYHIETTISEQLGNLLSTKVTCKFFDYTDSYIGISDFENIDEYLLDSKIEFKGDKEIVAYESDELATESYSTNILRSNCLITNQPDYADLHVLYTSKKYLLPENLLNYVLSFRDENHFHEEVVEIIYDKLFKLLEPTELFVAALYTRRGGIDINPVRVSEERLMEDITSCLINPRYLTIKSIRH